MASIVDICNRAISRVGGNRITAITDQTKAAKACNSAYEIVRNEVLRSHTWNCLTGRAQLAPLAASPAFEYTYQYQLPSDCGRLLEVDNDDYDYVVEGRKILTDYGTVLNIRYAIRELDTQQYDDLLVSVMAARLAVEICEELTQSRTKKVELKAEHKELLSDAKRVDSQEQSPSTFEEDDWIEARY